MENENNFDDRFTFVNLIDPDIIENHPESTNQFNQIWLNHRDKMLKVIISSDKACLSGNFKQSTGVEDWFRLNRLTIRLCVLSLSCLLFAFVIMVLMDHAQNLERYKNVVVEELQAANNATQVIQQKYKFFIGLGDAVFSVTDGARSVVSSFKWW